MVLDHSFSWFFIVFYCFLMVLHGFGMVWKGLGGFGRVWGGLGEFGKGGKGWGGVRRGVEWTGVCDPTVPKTPSNSDGAWKG